MSWGAPTLMEPATSCSFSGSLGGQYPGEDVLVLSILPNISLLCPLQAPAPQRKQFLPSAMCLLLSPPTDDLAIPASRVPSAEPRAAAPGAEPVPGSDGRGLHLSLAAQ